MADWFGGWLGVSLATVTLVGRVVTTALVGVAAAVCVQFATRSIDDYTPDR